MPNKWTFQIKPIAELLAWYVGDGKGWIDPFAGIYSPADITNDLNPDMPTQYHLEALEFLKQFENCSIDGVLFDPPYSFHQVLESYRGYGKGNYPTKWGDNNKFWLERKNEVVRIVKPNGKVICFGWNSGGIGKNRGFQLDRILLVCHGGMKNDTIVTVERKLQSTFPQ